MTHVSQMLETNPTALALDRETLARCIEECFACAQTCTACADACLGEEQVADLRACIRLDLDCADVCITTGRVLTRQTAFDAELARSVLEACGDACRRCGAECEKHAEHHDHCRVCAEACRRCAEACDDLLAQVGR